MEKEIDIEQQIPLAAVEQDVIVDYVADKVIERLEERKKHDEDKRKEDEAKESQLARWNEQGQQRLRRESEELGNVVATIVSCCICIVSIPCVITFILLMIFVPSFRHVVGEILCIILSICAKGAINC